MAVGATQAPISTAAVEAGGRADRRRPPRHFGPNRFTSHSRIFMSALPEASVLPSGLNATQLTASVCPVNFATSLPDATSHSRIVLSAPHEAIVLPSGLKATP